MVKILQNEEIELQLSYDSACNSLSPEGTILAETFRLKQKSKIKSKVKNKRIANKLFLAWLNLLFKRKNFPHLVA